jgi:hypothetical protein
MRPLCALVIVAGCSSLFGVVDAFTNSGRKHGFSPLRLSPSAAQEQTILVPPLASPKNVVPLSTVEWQEYALIDGPALQSIQPTSNSRSSFAVLSVVAGYDINQELVIGIPCLDGSKSVQVYKDSIVQLPEGMTLSSSAPAQSMFPWGNKKGLTTLDLVSTIQNAWMLEYVLSLEGIGGDQSATRDFPHKVVVVGGSQYASQVCQALQVLGSTPIRVSTSKVSNEFQVLTPASGPLDLGFANVIGTFDALVDTLDHENNSLVLRMLREQHGCRQYISTVGAVQAHVLREGLFAKQEKQYRAKLVTQAQSIIKQGDLSLMMGPPPRSLGRSVSQLLAHGVTFDSSSSSPGGVQVRDWSLQDYWESNTWPRDATANVRFGFPAVEDLTSVDDEDQDEEESEQDEEDRRYSYNRRFVSRKGSANVADDDEDLDDGVATEVSGQFQPAIRKGANPFVLSVVGLPGLQQHIMDPQLDCVLFLSAPFCRTCGKMNPSFNRMARTMGTPVARDEAATSSGGLLFAKAEAVGQQGKALGRALGVDSVPNIFLFRKGKPYGGGMGITRLPSKKLNLVIEYMQTGRPWDDRLFGNGEEDADA